MSYLFITIDDSAMNRIHVLSIYLVTFNIRIDQMQV